MLLTIDIGNTNVTLGAYNSKYSFLYRAALDRQRQDLRPIRD